jgi:SSS family solute:Na+ symporter
MPVFSVTPLDILILITYVMGTRIILGWYLARKLKTGGAERYFLADRNLAWPLIGLSFYVSNMSGSSFVGLTGSGYHNGISVYHYEWLPALILILFIVFVLPFYLRSRVFTAPGFLERRFDGRAKLAFSGFLLAANIFIDAAAAIYAGGMVLQTLFPEIPLWFSSTLICAIAGGYIFFGGLHAVVFNDTIQAGVILAGGTIVAVMTFQKIPSWESIHEAAPAQALHLIQPATDPVLPWPGIITGVLIVGIYFWCTNQFIIQRTLGARSLHHGRWGALFAGLLKLPNLFILILPGVAATALYPGLERPDLVFPTLAFDMLPIGWRGLMLAALAAAILSSLEAIFNSASTLFTMDFVKHFRPATPDRQLVSIGRAATLVFMVLAAAWAPQIARFPTLWQYLQSILSYVTPPVVAVFMLGLLWRRMTSGAAFLILIAGIPLGVTGWILVEVLGLLPVQYLYASGIMFSLSVLAGVVISLGRPAPLPKSADSLVWSPREWRLESIELKNTPWYGNYRVLSGGLILLCGAILWWWW